MKRLKTQTPRRLKRVWDFAKPYTPLFLLAELCILVTYAVSLFLPQNLLRLTDQVLIGGDHPELCGPVPDGDRFQPDLCVYVADAAEPLCRRCEERRV